jgi:DNA-binding IclR family transcriptional regulator
MMTALAHDLLESKRSVLGRVFDLLECFTDDAPEQTISSLCARTGLPPATVHRMLATLAEWGAVERAARGRYRLGMRLWRLGWGVPGARVLKDVARPHLVDLHTITGEVVVLCSRDDGDVILSDVIAGRAASRQWHLPRRLPLTASAAGHAFLAHLPDPDVADASDAARPADPWPAGELARRQALDEIRRNGYAVTHSAAPGGIAWVAAPVFDGSRTVRAAIALPVAEDRLNVLGMGRVVSAAARAVSQELGRAAMSAS